MLNWLRSRTLMIAALLVVVFALAGCGGAKEEPKTEPAAQNCPTCPTCEKVDKAAILTDAAKQYFNTLPTTSNMIDAKDVKTKVDAKDATIFLLDIRAEKDFTAGHVEGFTNIPFATLGANFDKLPKDKQIIVTCYSGQTAGQAVAVLKMAGYNAISLKGGFPSLSTAGFEVKK